MNLRNSKPWPNNRILDDKWYDFVGSTRWVAQIHLEVTMGNNGEGRRRLQNKIETWAHFKFFLQDDLVQAAQSLPLSTAFNPNDFQD